MKIIIHGFYGIRNLGDDYLLLSILKSIEKSNINSTEIQIWGKGDQIKDITNLFPKLRINPVVLENGYDVIHRLLSIDDDIMYIFGGGGLFPNGSLKSYLKLLVSLLIVKSKGKAILYGIDICRIEGQLSKIVWKLICKNSEKIIFRNQYSKLLLDKFCKSDKVFSSSDITFSLETTIEENEKHINKLLEKVGLINNEYLIWIVAMPYDSKEMQNDKIIERYNLLVRQIAKLVDSYSDRNHLNVFLPFYHGTDTVLINDIVSIIKSRYIVINEDSISLEEKRALFIKAKAAISMRFHGVAFALKHGIPVLAISYAPKIGEMMKEVDLLDYTIEYGIRNTSTLFIEKDLEYDELKRKCDLVVLEDNNRKFSIASNELVKKGQCAEKEFIEFINRWKDL